MSKEKKSRLSTKVVRDQRVLPDSTERERLPDVATMAQLKQWGELADRPGTTSGRQKAMLQLQQQYGNAFVQRWQEKYRNKDGSSPGTTGKTAPAPPLIGADRDVAATAPRVDRSNAGPAADPHYAGPALRRLPSRGPVIQRDLTGPFPTRDGQFVMNMIAKQDAIAGTGPSGLDGSIKFEPDVKAPYSNKIGLVQIVKLTDDKGANIDPASMPAGRGPSLRTAEDKKGGVEGGFFTDVLHFDFGPAQKAAPPKSALPSYYAGGTPVFGFKRSDDKADIKAAELQDFPGVQSTTLNLDFSFETVAKADDTMHNFGALKWAFKLRAGKVVNEQASVSDDASATYEAALEKHWAFYTHEPVIFYFGFDQDQPEAGETDKIDSFLEYLRQFPDVTLTPTGFADMRGNAAYNRALALRRARSVVAALQAKGIDAARINPPTAVGATTQFTTDAATDQDLEANRRGNRRVVLTFERGP